jgi:hypothetical protein
MHKSYRRAKLITSQVKKLDIQCASKSIGDGSSGVAGPFEAAQKLFIRGQVVPLVVGGFGEANKDIEKMVRT